MYWSAWRIKNKDKANHEEETWSRNCSKVWILFKINYFTPKNLENNFYKASFLGFFHYDLTGTKFIWMQSSVSEAISGKEDLNKYTYKKGKWKKKENRGKSIIESGFA